MLVREPVWVERALDQSFKIELAGCDALVHFASHTPNRPYAPIDECLYWNVFATVRLLQQAAANGVRDFIVAGSCFEYGAAAEGLDFVHPSTEPRPSLTYPISKAAAATACLGLARHLGLRLQLLRIFQVYGEGEAITRFWPSMRKAALEGRDFHMSAGTQIRDFIHVSEVASQFIRALDFSSVEPGRPTIRNVGKGEGQTLIDFATMWWERWGANGVLVPGELELHSGELARLVANIEDVYVA